LRSVDKLRVSVTDRCNLRCMYCMPETGIALKPKNEILSFREIERAVRITARRGVTKVRLTGGEPLVRKGIERLIEALSSIEEINDLALTTNGILLKETARPLKQAGLDRVTISMDTLDPEKYRFITKRPGLEKVLSGIEAARNAGLEPVKINVVALRGINDDEAVAFAAWAAENDLEARFIELMPISRQPAACREAPGSPVLSDELKQAIEEKMGKLDPLVTSKSSPARVYALPRGSGKIGFISPISKPFCAGCTRLRLTADGKLRPCLASPEEIDLKGPMRSGAGDRTLLEIVDRAIEAKSHISGAMHFDRGNRTMCEIGG